MSALEERGPEPRTVCNAEPPAIIIAISVAGLPGVVDIGAEGTLRVHVESTSEVDGIAQIHSLVASDAGRVEATLLRADLAARSSIDHDVHGADLSLPADGGGHLTLWGALETPDGRLERAPSLLMAFQSAEDGWSIFDGVGREQLRRIGMLQIAEREQDLRARIPAGVVADEISLVHLERLEGDRPEPDGPPDPDGEGGAE